MTSTALRVLLALAFGTTFLLLSYTGSTEASGSALNRSNPSVPSETLSVTATVDEPLLLNLPESLNDSPVNQYTPLRIPATSWVAGTAFYWRPDSTAEGEHELTLVAERDEAPRDTLHLTVTVQPE